MATIDRLVKAAGPCHECDAELAAIENGWQVVEHRDRDGVTMRRPDSSTFLLRYIEPENVPGFGLCGGGYGTSAYTRLFDVARRLIPDGLYWHAGEGKTRDDEPLGAAAIIEPGSLETIAEAEHESVVIAMCIAAIKARQVIRDALVKGGEHA